MKQLWTALNSKVGLAVLAFVLSGVLGTVIKAYIDQMREDRAQEVAMCVEAEERKHAAEAKARQARIDESGRHVSELLELIGTRVTRARRVRWAPGGPQRWAEHVEAQSLWKADLAGHVQGIAAASLPNLSSVDEHFSDLDARLRELRRCKQDDCADAELDLLGTQAGEAVRAAEAVADAWLAEARRALDELAARQGPFPVDSVWAMCSS